MRGVTIGSRAQPHVEVYSGVVRVDADPLLIHLLVIFVRPRLGEELVGQHVRQRLLQLLRQPRDGKGREPASRRSMTQSDKYRVAHVHIASPV